MTLRLLFLVSLTASASVAAPAEVQTRLRAQLDEDYASIERLYQHLHANPELSFMEINTAALVARELRAAGFEVTEKVGNTGVVAVLKNGEGPTLMIRADMDALPVKEATGVPYASTAIVNDLAGKAQPAMHACAHDTHVANLIGAARLLSRSRDQWRGTLVLIAQPAEEIGAGAVAMLRDGLYSRFPRPNFAIALHTWSNLPAGQIGYTSGPAYANVTSVDIVVRGFGGHGSRPHTTKDPVVLASEIVLALQTIVSREIKPGTPAVVTVGTIHGGSKRNIIPDEVTLELTLRSYDTAVADHMIASIRRISENLARAAGVPEERLPVVTVLEEGTPVTYNDPALTQRLVKTFEAWFGAERVRPEEPTTGGEDFSRYGMTPERVPIAIWWVGAADPARHAESVRTGIPLPSNHSATFAPLAEPTLKAGVLSLTAAALELLQ